jgi:hypothetical protein
MNPCEGSKTFATMSLGDPPGRPYLLHPFSSPDLTETLVSGMISIELALSTLEC